MTTTENIDAPTVEPQIVAPQDALDEGEVATNCLEELLDIADLDGDIDIGKSVAADVPTFRSSPLGTMTRSIASLAIRARS